ncbi:hypothetical protein ACJJIF_10025 [Microbulbifer sp. SSSA002]|uniref:hypothetical protein n=1 Tax=Microbulbifer sp. SSSA002 TaxID=3243376 RepID=UPI004039216A
MKQSENPQQNLKHRTKNQKISKSNQENKANYRAKIETFQQCKQYATKNHMAEKITE